MQNVKEERWRPTVNSTPSSRLRAARSMPPWMQSRNPAVPTHPVPPPPAIPPPPDPDYEVIEFTTQQAYSNAPPPRPVPSGKPHSSGQRCDLCGSTAPAVHCDKCSQQNFCMSCDEMYHRHPKRQTHFRKPLDNSRLPTLRPPLPPKGENTSAPVPPPRRHKRSGRNTPVPSDQIKAPAGFGVMGSLKRMMGGRPLPPAPPMGRDMRMPVSTSPLHFTDLQDHQPPSRDSGYLDWELDNRQRSGSLTALNAPPFSPLMHAQSMATLNCPSCHHHGLVWDWNQSHMMPGGMAPPWGGLPTGTWHGSAMLPQYRPESDKSRRNSLRAPPRRSRRDLTTDDEDDHRRPNISPVRSRRGQISDDSEDEAMSHRGSRRHRRRTSPISRTASPALSRRSSRKKSMGVEELIARRVKQNEEALRSGRYDDETISNRGSRKFDDETMSNRGSRRYDDETMSNRGGRRYDDETVSNRGGRRYDEERLSIKSGRRPETDEILSNRSSRKNDFDDSMSSRSQRFDDDLISNRGSRRSDVEETMSNRGGRRLSDSTRKRRSPTQMRKYDARPPHASSEDSGDEMSDGLKKSSTLTRQSSWGVSNESAEKKDEDENFPSDVDKPLGPIPTQEWECDHCTFVNQAGTRVCTVCCKTTISPKHKQPQNVQQPNQKVKNEPKSQVNQNHQPRHQNSSTSPLKDFPDVRESVKKEESNKKEIAQLPSLSKHPSTKPDDMTEATLADKMKQLTVTPAQAEKKKGKRRRTISFWLGTKLYS